MTIPNVDTFEHDIAEEIRTKEASLTDIASAGGDVNNNRTNGPQASNTLVVLGAVCIFVVIGIFIALFFLYGKDATSEAPLVATSTQQTTNNQLLAISQTLSDQLGGNIQSISKSEYGYVLRLISYSPVFSYMIKNERAYADELALAVRSPRDTGTSSLPFIFTDVTLNNQNMRVGTSGSSTVVYAFINAEALVISSSTQGILALRGAILQK